VVLRTVVLDYGGVVVHEDPAEWDALGRSVGLAPGRLWAAFHEGAAYAASRRGLSSREEHRAAVLATLAAEAGAAVAAAALERLAEAQRRHPPIRPVMRELLDGLAGRAARVLLSNAPRGTTERLARRGVARCFEAVVCSGDVGVAKPDPAAYGLALAAVAAEPASTLFVDDQPENVAAARDLGLQALHYHESRHDELLAALAAGGLRP
jgi:putative hydrolase of the HAD superfamily